MELSQHDSTENAIRPPDNKAKLTTTDQQEKTGSSLPTPDNSHHTDRSNPLNDPPILAACRYNQIAWLQELLKEDPALAYRAAPSGMASESWVYPLCIAAREGHEQAVEQLLAALGRLPEGKRPGGSIMAVINAADRLGRTPLHLAAAGGHIKVVERLLKAVDRLPETQRSAAVQRLLSATDNNGQTPLQLASQRNHHEVEVLLRDARQKLPHTPRPDSILPEVSDQPGLGKLPAAQPGTSNEACEVSPHPSLPVVTVEPATMYVPPPLSCDEFQCASLVNPIALVEDTDEPKHLWHWTVKNDQSEWLKYLVLVQKHNQLKTVDFILKN
ncbi:ankyrin repeat domain-containing protein [Endozoicomonas sp. SCSIO W0465]|uniref:ankyrin repeat domain-containing protein n=1 Tax=Endozoicomonas sp. SCSIO W0465 TaxID=2918516 RepID=UPI00207651D3|nr:ankyrin repeat domain-containing protein [Endozoicomonas sp. SCSIO W0465]USE34282.1 ankyrin repeat domain-containing protein [Endozoicomonas sp. SCSIO W0465]